MDDQARQGASGIVNLYDEVIPHHASLIPNLASGLTVKRGLSHNNLHQIPLFGPFYQLVPLDDFEHR